VASTTTASAAAMSFIGERNSTAPGCG
jgi:hypothetical protein